MRDRLMLNSDWAVANYLSLCIYHFRCSLAQDEDFFTSPAGDGIVDTVSSLLILNQKSVATADSCQSDRMQWPLFWAGIEMTDPFNQYWILEKLRNEGLREALQCVMLVQAAGVRAGMARIRGIYKATYAGVPGADLVLPMRERKIWTSASSALPKSAGGVMLPGSRNWLKADEAQ
ncbi:hypothetical protein MMYC01_206127 [Madurella mycetomatis]|uniref:Uncharacterized protein n=1 Tax=Madurella mycetomatis TaxID=100816 RepID=A0A175W1U9_9PEZI|nr:hypothetical protein MMYC01_206127 [Madurella mycetomatis]